MKKNIEFQMYYRDGGGEEPPVFAVTLDKVNITTEPKPGYLFSVHYDLNETNSLDAVFSLISVENQSARIRVATYITTNVTLDEFEVVLRSRDTYDLASILDKASK